MERERLLLKFANRYREPSFEAHNYPSETTMYIYIPLALDRILSLLAINKTSLPKYT
jgi:hypothetical protein